MPVPIPTAISKFCIGNASETAVKALSLMRETKKLSTILYIACTSMEKIVGNDILKTRGNIFCTPIRF